MVPEKYSHLTKMIEAQLSVFPDHREYLERRFEDANDGHLALTDDLAGMVLQIAAKGLTQKCEDYRWLAGQILEEEWYFRRNGKYRLSKFEDALREVYANHDFMLKYVNGILLSQLWWRNHTEVLGFYRDRFLPGNPSGFSHLEVGPGHGLFLYLASRAPNNGTAEGWDVSATSLEETRLALAAMGAKPSIELKQIELTKAPERQFQSIVFSEVLEHLEDPLAALKILHRLLAPGGRIFVNAPVNSPAPDHIYLFKTPEEVSDMVREAGFTVAETFATPQTGIKLPRARKIKASISSVVIATRS